MKRILVAVAAMACGLSGCASARYVEKNPDSGIIAIPSNADFWPIKHRTAALALIEKHVGPEYEIFREEEVVTGVTTNHNQQIKREPTYNSEVPFFEAEKHTITNSTSTSDHTEYRLAYRRRPAPHQTQYPPTTGVQPAGGVVPAVPGVAGRGAGFSQSAGADCKQ